MRTLLVLASVAAIAACGDPGSSGSPDVNPADAATADSASDDADVQPATDAGGRDADSVDDAPSDEGGDDVGGRDASGEEPDDAAPSDDAAADAETVDGDDADADAVDSSDGSGDPEPRAPAWQPQAGATVTEDRVSFAIVSPHATRVQAWLYAVARDADEVAIVELERADDGLWRGEAPLPPEARWYGLRLWGPNWPSVDTWEPGSSDGFIIDVDAAGNRFNPNKLVFDPWALEISHDPRTAIDSDWNPFKTGPDHRSTDSAARAPKGLLLTPTVRTDRPEAPTRALNDDVIYEVHVRNFTRNALDLPAEIRGTYAGAAARAEYLAAIGVTAIEFLPLHESQNEQNDVEVGTSGDNMWGYASLSFFAPERRYAADRTPGGATRELMDMVDAFHAVGIKVFVDVVFNHTAEGGASGDQRETANLISWRGVDNIDFYQVFDGRFYRNDNGVGPNIHVATEASQRMVLDSLRYWHETIGVDGFRFDLASVLGNTCEGNCFTFSPDFLLTRIAAELPARPATGGVGVDLIAEPWAIGAGTYQVGNFPAGWFEWNDRFRDMVRELQNIPSVVVSPNNWLNRLDGSSDLFGDRSVSASINYVVSHDGMTFFDLYRCNGSNNTQPWPWGPSSGGESYNRSWDQGSDATAQRQALRTGMALLALSGGAIMFTGGDERMRTQRCNNNPYNLDSDAMGLDWVGDDLINNHLLFTSRLLAFRAVHPELRIRDARRGADRDLDGTEDLVILDAGGNLADSGERNDSSTTFFAWRVDLEGPGPDSIVVAYNRGTSWQTFFLPAPVDGHAWYRVCDTDDFAEPEANFWAADDYYRMGGRQYDVNPRSVVVWLQR